MGILDSLNKVLDRVDKTTGTADRTFRSADRANQMAKKVGDLVNPNCKYCKVELKTDPEKKKGICMNCALARA
ncbi:MAG: hypothetical protein Q7S92_06420 [Candidatus Diapherotrites archaeon]|nr:hypothetical protein [Candidatus Diapherotrites archaeon]